MGSMEYPMYIGGQWVQTGERRTVRLPYDGSPVAEYFVAGPEQVEAAVRAARAAAPVMREMTLAERARILRKAAQRLEERHEEVAMAISSESGKPLREARVEVDRGIQTLSFSAEEAHRLAGEVVPMEAAPAGKGHWAITVREPLGVIAAITPFNFPLNLSLHKIGPALAAGNAVVHKPASATPVSALLMAEIFEECGLPAGALNVITGPGGAIGDLLASHPDVAMVTFTGSPEVGQRIHSMARMKRVTLELGNNSALIVDADAALDEAVARAVPGSFANSGQVCISIQRIYVHRSVVEEFTARFVEATRALKLGHPYDPSTEISSLITEAEAARVEEWIAEAVQAGARLLIGGKRKGAIMEPAVLADVPPHVRLSCREVFGPVVGINAFDQLDEAIELVNRSDYGLQAGIYTRDIGKAFYAARKLHVGGVMINEIPQYRVDHMPYGGVKLSGMGREGPRYAIEEMTECKLICWKL
jgi:acyl-CoA reductase-like NAD-dependent aldehyde dehydrogenase